MSNFIITELSEEQKQTIANQIREAAYFFRNGGPFTFNTSPRSIKKVAGLDNTFVIIRSRQGFMFGENEQADKVIAFGVDSQFNAVNLQDVCAEKGSLHIDSAVFHPDNQRIFVGGIKIQDDTKWQGSVEWKKI